MSDDQKRVAAQYNYALSGAPFKCIFFDITEQVTVSPWSMPWRI